MFVRGHIHEEVRNEIYEGMELDYAAEDEEHFLRNLPFADSDLPGDFDVYVERPALRLLAGLGRNYHHFVRDHIPIERRRAFHRRMEIFELDSNDGASDTSIFRAPYEDHSLPSDFDGVTRHFRRHRNVFIEHDLRHIRPRFAEDFRRLPGYIEQDSSSVDEAAVRRRMLEDPDIIIPRAESSVEIEINGIIGRNETQDRERDAWFGELLSELGNLFVENIWFILILMAILWSKSDNSCSINITIIR